MANGTLASTDPKLEFASYYANTSLFALDVLRRHGQLNRMSLLSVACHMPHLADYLALFDTVHHNSVVETRLPVPAELCPATFVEHRCDFFDLPDELHIDAVISHAAFHCFNDSRYGNGATAEGWAKPYEVPAKLRRMFGGRRVPVVFSVSVHRQEVRYDGNSVLGHDKLVAAFEGAGFRLAEHFFDHLCGGYAFTPAVLGPELRRSKVLPETASWPGEWVAGNYYFV